MDPEDDCTENCTMCHRIKYCVKDKKRIGEKDGRNEQKEKRVANRD